MNEQICLFDDLYKSELQQFADRVCEEFNKLDTVYKGTFYVDNVNLSKWEHINEDNKVLEVTLKSTENKDGNRFIQFKGDTQSQLNLYNADILSEWLGKMRKDKDFAIAITPWFIVCYFHNFERKKIDYSSTRGDI